MPARFSHRIFPGGSAQVAPLQVPPKKMLLAGDVPRAASSPSAVLLPTGSGCRMGWDIHVWRSHPVQFIYCTVNVTVLLVPPGVVTLTVLAVSEAPLEMAKVAVI